MTAFRIGRVMGYALAILCALAIVVLLPLVTLWSLNTLFGLGIPFTLATWTATWFLGVLTSMTFKVGR